MESVSNDVQEMLTVRTAGYRPPMQYRPSSLSRGLPPFTISVIEWMRRDSQIKLGMCIKAAPFHKVKLTIKGDPEVVKFMSENIRRFWTKAIPKVIRGFWYTICGGEIQHKINPVTGRQEFWNLYDVYPLDLRILHQNRVPCGVSIRPNGWVQEGSVDGVDPMDSKPIRLFFPKGFLYIHGREFNSLIGISDFEAAYDPWLEKNDWQGAKHSRKLWFYKNAFSGGILLHPPGNYETENNVMIPYRDLARQAMETSLNGAVWCLENKPDPATGQQQWQYIEPKINGGGAELINYVHELDNEMLRGLSIPDDVVTQVSGGGSFAGRTIPLMAFLISQESTLNNLFTVCDEQVFRPICKTNFGHDNYEASMAIDIDRIMGVMNAGEVGDSGDANANSDENDQMEAGGKIVSSEPTQFSDDGINNLIDVMEGKPFTVRVVQDMEGKGTVRYSGIRVHPGTDVFQFAQVHAPHNMVVQGKKYRGGEFIPGNVIAKATPQEKAKLGIPVKTGTPSTKKEQPVVGGNKKPSKPITLTGPTGKTRKVAAPALSKKAQRALDNHVYIGTREQRYAENECEAFIAKALGGLSLPDSEPVDVVMGQDAKTHNEWSSEAKRYSYEESLRPIIDLGNGKTKKGGKPATKMELKGKAKWGLELKTMIKSGKEGDDSKATMDTYSQIRKAIWEKEHGATYHTLIIDDRNCFDAKGVGKHDLTKRKMYYRRGIAGSARPHTMVLVKDVNHLKQLMAMEEHELPLGGHRSDTYLAKANWVPTVGIATNKNTGKTMTVKGFKNTKYKQTKTSGKDKSQYYAKPAKGFTLNEEFKD